MMKIHFLNVGHGDCIIVESQHTGRTSVIDINTSEEADETTKSELLSELSNISPYKRYLYEQGVVTAGSLLAEAGYDVALQEPVSYMKDIGISRVFRFISTHPHMDHLTGIKSLHEEIPIQNFWILKNTQTQDEKKLTDTQKQDWTFYKKYRDTNEYLLDGIYTVRPQDGDSRDFWNEDGITILAPDKGLLEHTKANKISYVLLIKYGGKKIVLGGDGENETWEYIMDNYANLIQNVSILKASHHGRDSGYHQAAVKHMNPLYTIVSVGNKPKTDASNKYRQYCDNVWSTRWMGNIKFEINPDGNWSYLTQYDR